MKILLKTILLVFSLIFLVGIIYYIILPFSIENDLSSDINYNQKEKIVESSNNKIEEKIKKEDNKFSFIVLGDSNSGSGSIDQPQAFQNIIQEIANLNDKPDFVIHNGDMIAGTSSTSSNLAIKMWDEFEKVAINPLFENNIGFFPSAGNHDASFNSILPSVYKEFWGNYKNIKDYKIEGNYNNYYSFGYKNCYFIIMNGSRINISEEQILWLEDRVNTAYLSSLYQHTFIFSHVPLTAISDYHSNDQLNPNDYIKDILKDKIRIFFGAHHNIFYDLELDGIRQVGVGRAGSGGTYQLKSEFGGGSQDYLSYVKVEFDGENFKVEQIIK